MRRRFAWLAVLAGLVVPGTAAGHAGLIRSTPADQQVLPAAPSALVLTFDEPVETALSDIRVFDDQAKEILAAKAQRDGSRSVRVPVAERLANGTYTVSWRVLSADGHPIDGTFVFHVGAPSPQVASVADRLGRGASAGVRRADDVLRILHVALIVLLLGALVATVVLFASVDPEVTRALWYVVAGLGFALSIVAAGTVIAQAALVTGSGLGEATNGTVLGTVLDTRLGKVRLVELVLAEIIAVGAVWASTTSSRVWSRGLLLLGALLAVTPGLSGHAGARGALAVVADTGHVIAASAWVGGLATVMLGLALARERRHAVARAVFPRFSSMAMVGVGVLIVAGVIGSVTHVDAWSQLWNTTYGRLLVAKMTIALTLIAFGVANRRRIRRLAADETGRQLSLLSRSVGVEFAVMAAVIAVTAFLIAQPPANATRSVAAPPLPSASVVAGDLAIRVTADPGRRGANRFGVVIERSGRSVDGVQVDVVVRPADATVGRATSKATRTSPGRYETGEIAIVSAGRWIVDVDVRASEFDLVSATVALSIGVR